MFEAVRDFNIQYPNVHFKILNNSTTDSVNALKEGKVDLAVVSASLQLAEPLKMKVVRKYREILIGGSRFAELKGRKTSLEELSAYPWISLTSEAISRRFLNEYFSRNGLQFSPDVELATTDTVSYTHLDVYKRQHGYSRCDAAGLSNMQLQGAVSIFAVNLKRILKLKGEVCPNEKK